jgi:hypothetical protein
LEVKRGENETYRGLMAKIQQSVNRFVGDEDPKVRLSQGICISLFFNVTKENILHHNFNVIDSKCH